MTSKTASQELFEFLERKRKRKRRLKEVLESYNATNVNDYKSDNPSKETVFKIVGWRKDQKAFRTATNYILKKSEHLTDELGNAIHKSEITDKMQEWGVQNSANKRQFVHIVYSFPKNVKNLDDIKYLMQGTLPVIFKNHKFMFGFHEDTKNTHVHILVNCKNQLTLKALRINPIDLEAKHKALDKEAMDIGLDIHMHKPKKFTDEMLAKVNSEKKIPLHKLYKEQSPNWSKKYEQNKFDEVEISEVTKTILDKIGLVDTEKEKFANLYLENKALAVWSITNNYKLYGLTKSPKIKLDINELTIKYKDSKLQKKADKSQFELYSNKPLSNAYILKSPNWANKYSKKQFDKVILTKKTKAILDKIGLVDTEKEKFANLYLENKALAVWSINKNYYLYGLAKSPNFSGRGLSFKYEDEKIQVNNNQKPITKKI